LWEYVKKLNKEGTTVLLTTHYLEEAEELCDAIAVINHGEVVACDKKTTLLRSFDSKQLVVTPSQPIAVIPPVLQVYGCEIDADNRLIISFKPSKHRIQDILDAVRSAGISISDLTTREADLEDIFLKLTHTSEAA
jgi:ABC-2 type transport system ATP-binding protein